MLGHSARFTDVSISITGHAPSTSATEQNLENLAAVAAGFQIPYTQEAAAADNTPLPLAPPGPPPLFTDAQDWQWGAVPGVNDNGLGLLTEGTDFNAIITLLSLRSYVPEAARILASLWRTNIGEQQGILGSLESHPQKPRRKPPPGGH